MNAETTSSKQHTKNVILLSLGAFLIIAYLVYARSLSKAYFLSTFEVETLSYIYFVVPLLALPIMVFFIRFLTQYRSKTVLFYFVLFFSILIALLAFLLDYNADNSIVNTKFYKALVVSYYFLQNLGLMVLTSGFWILVSGYFPLRKAKKIYGFISAGGTAGAMFAGNSMKFLNQNLEMLEFNLFLVALLLLLTAIYFLLPLASQDLSRNSEKSTGHKTAYRFTESLQILKQEKHLALIAAVVMLATFASTLLNFQLDFYVDATFKSQTLSKQEISTQISNFFGLYYGWTGAISLLLQVFVVGWLIARLGMGFSLSILPIILLAGIIGFLLIPGLAAITLVRGADNTLRKSLHRSLIELLYIPVPATLRKKTKSFIDSILDSFAESFAAIVIFLWVTYGSYSPIYLSYFALAALLTFFFINLKMHRQYLKTIVHRLKKGERAEVVDLLPKESQDILNATLSNHYANAFFEDRNVEQEDSQDSSDQQSLNKDQNNEEKNIDINALIRLLARDDQVSQVIASIQKLKNESIPFLTEAMQNPSTDFVIHRRLPQLMVDQNDEQVYLALLEGLRNQRFEIRYRSALALRKRREKDLDLDYLEYDDLIWDAIRLELGQSKPVWELHRLLDSRPEDDDLVMDKVFVRGQLGLEHVFRMMALVLDAENIRVAYHGTLYNDEKFKSLALEYLELVLPKDVKQRLWIAIGEVSESRKIIGDRSIDHVIHDLMDTGNTLLGDEKIKSQLGKILKDKEE